ncbi:hypothetical protein [Streptomyces spectabilis]|uniref:Uncharacterized protein n=1 Tax=Streptomyces spectabilis TaxID=68270 RepID=A0A516RAV6_STRST|nr:hypothetical protein [Streptomyces spectabilis]QDQ12797.1 hypothetical protein FH965_21340 [Streptomyces spectabilis]
MSPDPLQEHNFVSLMGIVLIALIAVTSLAAYAWVCVARRRPALSAALRAGAALCAAGATAVYAWGAVQLLRFDITVHAEACRQAVGAGRAARVDGYEATYFPLRFGCHVTGDGTYTAGVPGWLNPTALSLGLGAVALAIAAAAASPDFRDACGRRARSLFHVPFGAHS